ncbi:MAG TPA: hypothetical protein VM934_07335 [Pyrinomonadaceae bacterium]|jgi:LSD1 subclass zinc finger protein|nr:hypothetical protein [Pyrinomonadaceae bacterium]
MIHTLKCPSCGAPLDYEDGSDAVSIRCPFCNNSVVVPETLRKARNTFAPSSSYGKKAGPAHGFIFYLVIIFAVLFVATFALTRLFRSAPPINTTPPPRRVNFPPTPRGKATPEEPGFAQLLLKFGSEGIGPGLFNDSRSITLDGAGRIYVGDYTGGRIQVFDAEGKFITQWMADTKMPLRGLAADRAGVVYVVQSGEIRRYEGATGKLLGKLAFAGGWGFDDVIVTADGGLLAAWYKGSDDIVRFDSGGSVTKVIRKAISGQTDRSELDHRVAMDGLGNIYALGTFNAAVFKFTPEGRFVTKFGSGGDQPGQFHAPDAIAVDGQGRVYVSDIKGVQVFDADGRLIDRFQPDGIAFGMVFNDSNELFIASRSHVLKYAVKKP